MAKRKAKPKVGPYANCTKPNQITALYGSSKKERPYRPGLTNWPNEGSKPPGWLLDLMADEKLQGPKRDRRKPICGVCFVRKPCYCDEGGPLSL
jgi:hypothetical protein